MKLLISLLIAPMILFISGCDQESIANRGFSLPPGDAEEGKLLFSEYKCIECHVIAGTDFAGDEDKLTEGDGIAVILGGPSTKVKRYADLVTSIINPSHRIAKGYPSDQITYDDGESKMGYYNDLLTVEELVDLVTYLKPKYKLVRYPETHYPPYIYPH